MYQWGIVVNNKKMVIKITYYIKMYEIIRTFFCMNK